MRHLFKKGEVMVNGSRLQGDLADGSSITIDPPNFLTLREWLKRITYKPNFTLDIRPDYRSNEFVTIVIEMKVPDSTKPEHPEILITAGYSLRFEAVKIFELFFKQIDDFIYKMEAHERREWLRVDGKLMSNPHPEVPLYNGGAT